MSSKRQDILAAAERLFYRQGFGQVGVDRLAAEAGVALGTFYRQFRSRDEVVVGSMQARDAAYRAAMAKAATPPGAASVLQLLDLLEEWSLREGGNGCFFLRAAADHPHDPAIQAAALGHKRAFLDLLEQRVRAAGWSGEQAAGLAPALLVIFEGAVAAAFTLGDREAIAQARRIAGLVLAATPPA